MEQWGIPVAALLISIATFIAAQIQVRKKAGVDYVSQLHDRLRVTEERVRELEQKVRECEQERAALVRENIELNRQLARLVMDRRESSDK